LPEGSRHLRIVSHARDEEKPIPEFGILCFKLVVEPDAVQEVHLDVADDHIEGASLDGGQGGEAVFGGGHFEPSLPDGLPQRLADSPVVVDVVLVLADSKRRARARGLANQAVKMGVPLPMG